MASPQHRAKSASPGNAKRRIVPVTLNISADGYKPPAEPLLPPSRKGKERETTPSSSSAPMPAVKLANGHATPNGTPNGRHRPANGTPNGHVSARKHVPNGNGSQSTPKQTPNGTAQHTPASSGKKEKGTKKAPIVLDMSWPQEFRSRSAAGLVNGSMACYANATLQVIMHTPPVLKVALGHDSDDCECCFRAWEPVFL